jgi:hypothetical protein
LNVWLGFVVLDLLHYLSRILMPFQFGLNEVTPYATHSNYSVEFFPYDDSTEANILEWRGIFTRDLSRLTVRPIVEHNDAGI